MSCKVSQAVTSVESDVAAIVPVAEAVRAVVAADASAAAGIDSAVAEVQAVTPLSEAVEMATPRFEAFFRHFAAIFKSL